VKKLDTPKEHYAFCHTAQPARLRTFLLDDVENYETDRVAAHALAEHAPWLTTAAFIGREFAQQSSRFALKRGIRQVLDIGAGYPVPDGRAMRVAQRGTKPRAVLENHHRIAAGIAPGASTLYVDHDPYVAAHWRCHLERPCEEIIEGDLLDMEGILASPKVTDLVDLTRSVAVHLQDVLSWITDGAALQQAMSVLRDWMPPGSLLSISHFTGHWHPPHALDPLIGIYQRHGLPVRPRTEKEVASLFGDFVQLGPGLTAPHLWHSASQYRTHPPEHSASLAGIAYKRRETP
jgi:hypothetical protein